ncbi:MAG: hypothetical protein SV062_14945, partial [Thermodesulfobacteriota bacterium]|nr:hypothetical protein [Thermodesulfobacteriota bacterium]
ASAISVLGAPTILPRAEDKVAPRTLMALAQDRVIPLSGLLSRKSKKGEPRYALLLSGIVIEVSLLLGNLNTIAPLLTMFFLITYGAINLAVSIEKGIGIPSFRPTFNIPLIIPLAGGLWCLITMFLINPEFATISIILILIFYGIQVKLKLRANWDDIRSGMFNAIAEWAAKTSARLPYHAKSWKPNLMIPIEDPKSWPHLMEFVKDIVFPSGTLRLFTVKIIENGLEQRINQMASLLFRKEDDFKVVKDEKTVIYIENELNELVIPIKNIGIFVANTVIEARNFLEGISIITQVMKGMFFPPNTIFFTMSSDPSKDKRLEEMIAISIRENLGIIILAFHPKAAFGRKERVNIWLRSGSPNRDMSILMALQLGFNWVCNLRLISIVDKKEEIVKTELILRKIADLARMPAKTEILTFVGNFKEAIAKIDRADLNIIGMSNEPDCDSMHEVVELANTSCLFVKDSGEESVFA